MKGQEVLGTPMTSNLKLAHMAIATPGRCGLYETTRELVAWERKEGADARIVDPDPHDTLGPKNGEDRGVPIASMEWGTKADLIVNHSGFDRTPIGETEQPVLHVSHGRPLSTFLGERNGAAPGLTWQTQKKSKDRYRGVVTFWPEFKPYLHNIWKPKPVYAVTPPTDLDYWTPGDTKYNFYKHGGGYNVVMTDPWSREDSSPYPCIHAFCLFREMVSDARLHMFAWDSNKKALTGLTNLLGPGGGVITGWVTNMREVLRAADMLITPHRIYTRSIREAMACGCQVVSGRDVLADDVESFASIMVQRRKYPRPTRKLAEAKFNPEVSAKEFLQVVEGVLMLPNLGRGV